MGPWQAVRETATVMQEFTQRGGVRPFGVSLLMAGYDSNGRGRTPLPSRQILVTTSLFRSTASRHRTGFFLSTTIRRAPRRSLGEH